jgi:hypothetical protein
MLEVQPEARSGAARRLEFVDGGAPALSAPILRRAAADPKGATAPRRASPTAAKSPRDDRGSVHRATPVSAVEPAAPLPDPPGEFSSHEPLRRHGLSDYDEKPIGALTTNILASRGELPANYAAARFDKQGVEFHTVGTSRPWMELVYDWEATSFCHGPLYFEEPNAERLGHTAGLAQPVVSGAHFFARIPALPYMIAAEPPAITCTYTLGHDRPGSDAPFRYIRLPLSISGAAVQAGVVTGLVYLIP